MARGGKYLYLKGGGINIVFGSKCRIEQSRVEYNRIENIYFQPVPQEQEKNIYFNKDSRSSLAGRRVGTAVLDGSVT